MKSVAARPLVLVIGGTLAHGVLAAEPADSIKFGVGSPNPLPHCELMTYAIEYEHRLTPTMFMVGRGSNVDYRHDETNSLEDGYIRGLDIGARYYPAGQMQGFYGGMSLGYWKNDWSFINNRKATNPEMGEADSQSIRLNIDLGYRFQIGDGNISVMPEVNFGKFYTSMSCDYTAPASAVGRSCDQKSDVTIYMFAGVALGIAF